MALFKGGFQVSTLGAHISQQTAHDRHRFSLISTVKLRPVFDITLSRVEVTVVATAWDAVLGWLLRHPVFLVPLPKHYLRKAPYISLILAMMSSQHRTNANCSHCFY